MKKQKAREILDILKAKGFLKNNEIEKIIHQEIIITDLKNDIDDLNYQTENLISKINEVSS